MTGNEMALMANIAVDMQNKEVNDVLKQIRAEIEQMDFDFGDFYDHTSTIREMVLEVIDRYKAESEE